MGRVSVLHYLSSALEDGFLKTFAHHFLSEKEAGLKSGL